MMSIFSSFDVLAAESFGLRSSLSWPSCGSTVTNTPAHLERKDLSSIDGLKNRTGGGEIKETSARISTPSKEQDKWPTDRNQQHPAKPRRNPRIAIELDGVHCFETIVPY
ncbi:hypothetical protein Nepgr_021559 [Nepenthes gracilis]|uniref:Uncharacterized protein n=1 Tax=Nepenthes gracilis TaxID=150966 RepID=A0AAD3SYG2_NEPGR|nr:hypothetical protein Nepgr_021559 [Nepenthes gracilis]